MASKKKETHPLLQRLKVIFACVLAGVVALGIAGLLIWISQNEK